jgi:hypothetical protein
MAGPKWELLDATPGVFVRVANAGVTLYGKQKSVKRKGLGRAAFWKGFVA